MTEALGAWWGPATAEGWQMPQEMRISGTEHHRDDQAQLLINEAGVLARGEMRKRCRCGVVLADMGNFLLNKI